MKRLSLLLVLWAIPCKASYYDVRDCDASERAATSSTEPRRAEAELAYAKMVELHADSELANSLRLDQIAQGRLLPYFHSDSPSTYVAALTRLAIQRLWRQSIYQNRFRTVYAERSEGIHTPLEHPTERHVVWSLLVYFPAVLGYAAVGEETLLSTRQSREVLARLQASVNDPRTPRKIRLILAEFLTFHEMYGLPATGTLQTLAEALRELRLAYRA